MATFERVSRAVPSARRSVRITDVSAGDRIDIEDILGRPARGIKLYTGTATDTLEFKLNNLIHLPQKIEGQAPTTVSIWSGSGAHSTFSVTDAKEHDTKPGLLISSIEIVALTLSVGTTIEIVAH